jgi:hypothetical protein
VAQAVGEEEGGDLNDDLLDDSARPPPTLQPPTPTPTQKTTSTAGYRRARVVVRSAWPRPVPWPLGVVTAPDRPDDLAGTVKVVRYAEPTATGRAATRWSPPTDATVTVQVTEVG